MKVLMLSKALVVGAYQKKAEELAKLPGMELTVAVPPGWREPGVGMQPLERRFTEGYRLEVLPIVLNGRHHEHFFPTLGRLIAEVRPDVFHIDEESFNFATFHAMRLGVRYGARCCFYNWATIDRWYPPPFAFFERYNFRHAAHAIVGVQDAAKIVRKHGYSGPLSILPQFGVDPDLFAFVERSAPRDTFTIGYLGRLLPQKGLMDVVEVLPRLPDHMRLRLVGEGVQRPQLLARASELGVADRLEILPWTSDVPAALHEFDALVLPSRSTPTWTEQFGRVLIESMSCGVPVVGSSSGEIPRVIGDAGLVFAEGDLEALAAALLRLAEDAALYRELSRRGRERVMAQYTQAALAKQYGAIYQSMTYF
jgi:glycosyltransferase involved in cell wall biosynthesis